MDYIIVICHLSWILITLSYLISFVISFIIIDKRVSTEEFVYYLSKIATMKNIVKINHNSKIFDHFNSQGELEGITTKYYRLLNLTTTDGCVEGYKKCGILDTIGNTLCIDNNFPCPINNLTVDLFSNRNNYSNKGMKEIYNENLIYNYKFYYSNESLDGNNIVSLLYSEEKPRYITSSNFIIDIAAFKDKYNDNLNYQNNNNKEDKGVEFGEKLINIFVSDNYVESLLKASISLISLITDSDNDKEKFKNYVEKKLETEENEIDKYYINVGENAYIKNYIGFKSLNDIDKFMDLDYNIYKYKYPTKVAYQLALATGIIVFIVFIFGSCYFCYIVDVAKDDKKNNTESNPDSGKDVQIAQYNETMIGMNNNNNPNEKKENVQINKTNNEGLKNKIKERVENCRCRKRYTAQFIITPAFIGLNLGLLIYSAWVLNKNHDYDKNLRKLGYIESDDFIKSFLSEYKEECKISKLIIPAIVFLGSAILIHIIGFGMFLNLCCC